MAPHSSALAWKIPWTEESGRLQSMGSRRVWQDWATSLSLFAFMHWRRKWQPTPVFLPGESQGWGSLVGCCLWDCTESDRLKQLSSSSSIILLLKHTEKVASRYIHPSKEVNFLVSLYIKREIKLLLWWKHQANNQESQGKWEKKPTLKVDACNS